MTLFKDNMLYFYRKICLCQKSEDIGVCLQKEDANKFYNCQFWAPVSKPWLILPMLRLYSSKAQGCKDFENHLNPVMLVFIRKL